MAGAARQARKDARKCLGSLRDLTIAPATKARYDNAVRMFLRWSELCKVEVFGSNAQLIGLIEDFVEMCWEEGEARSQACDSLSGLQFFIPELKGRLRGAWRLCKAWQRQELPARATPLSRTMVWAMAMAHVRKKRWRYAAGYLIAFEVFLRTGELLSLRKQDVVLDQGGGSTAVLHLGFTKSGKRRGEPESVVLRDKQVTLALAMALVELEPGDFLIDGSPAAFRATFAHDIRALGLSADCYKPYSLRRGGATHSFRSGVGIQAVAEQGRWAHLATCRIYVNDAVAEVTRITLPKPLERKINQGAAELAKFLAA